MAAQTGADALTHAIESYLVPTGHAITDALALSAIRMIVDNLPSFVTNSRDVAAAGQMLLASCMASLCFKNTGLALAHSLSHPVGAYFHVAHGLACAFYLPAVMEFNAPSCPDKFIPMADALGVDVRGLSRGKAAAGAARAVRGLFERLGLPKSFSEMGVEFHLHPKMVDDTVAAPVIRGNPRKAEPREIEELFLSVR